MLIYLARTVQSILHYTDWDLYWSKHALVIFFSVAECIFARNIGCSHNYKVIFVIMVIKQILCHNMQQEYQPFLFCSFLLRAVSLRVIRLPCADLETLQLSLSVPLSSLSDSSIVLSSSATRSFKFRTAFFWGEGAAELFRTLGLFLSLVLLFVKLPKGKSSPGGLQTQKSEHTASIKHQLGLRKKTQIYFVSHVRWPFSQNCVLPVRTNS